MNYIILHIYDIRYVFKRSKLFTSRYMVLERKSMPIVAWEGLSKLSYMNLKEFTLYHDLFRKYNFFYYRQYLVIRLVLPTLCSPRKTNLNFLKMIFSFDLRKCCRLSHVNE